MRGKSFKLHLKENKYPYTASFLIAIIGVLLDAVINGGKVWMTIWGGIKAASTALLSLVQVPF